MRYLIAMLICAGVLSGCATASVQRVIHDEDGRVIARIDVKHNATTADGARVLMDSARRYENGLGATRVAEKSVDKGMPTALNTPGNNVTSGFAGFPQFYGQPGGVYSDVMAAERMTLLGQGRLPVLQPGVAPGMTVLPALRGSARVPCPPNRPPASDAERLSCLEKDRDAIGQRVFNKN